jgi:hypothetical protein
MQEHLQNLRSQGYTMVVELATCRMPEYLSSPVSAGGYVVACAAFYEWGFSVSSHRFLCSLLQFYGLELHHLTASGILHIAAFVTLCEAYMGIEPHFNLWNYFFCAWLQQGSGAEAATLGSVDIFIISGHRVDPYLRLPMPGPPDEWQKVWFFLRNDVYTLLPMFTGSHLVPQPNWWYSVAKKDLHRLQPLCEVVQRLLPGG